MANTDLTGSSEITWSPGKTGVMTQRVDCTVDNLVDGNVVSCFAYRKGWAITSAAVYVVAAGTSCQIDMGYGTAKTTDNATFLSNASIGTAGTMLIADGADGDDPADAKDVFPFVMTADGYINITMEANDTVLAKLDVTIGVMDLSGSDV